MSKFKAFRVHTIDGKPECRFEQLGLDDWCRLTAAVIDGAR